MNTHIVKIVSITALFTLASCSITIPYSYDNEGQRVDNETATINPGTPAAKQLKTEQAVKVQSVQHKPKNIVMVVADGMGPAYTTAYRLYQDDPKTEELEITAIDKVLTGSARTYPAAVSGYVTDSAASATALSTGVKTYNGAIAVDVDKKPLETVLQRAKAKGLKTGVAVTSQIVHATPAAYVASNESRRNYNALADSFLNDRIDGKPVADVMLGGGWDYFLRDDANLVAGFQALGYQYADSYKALANLPAGQPTLGLFADTGLPWALDDSNAFRLSLLTSEAVRQLNNEKGFFLLVEASQVDWAGHGNDISSAMAEMADLEQTMIFLQEYVDVHPDTLVILTADHSTGGLTIGANGDYRWSPEVLHGIKSSMDSIAKTMFAKDDPIAFVSEQFGFVLSDTERELVASINADMNTRARTAILKQVIDLRTNTGWTTSGHTGIDVGVYAFGKGAEHFMGNMNNTDIALKIFDLLEK